MSSDGGILQSSRRDLWWARITCLSGFGPYVTGSARTEQIVVLASLAVVLVMGWPRMMTARSFGPAPFLVAWCGMYAIMLIATAWRAFDPDFYGLQPASHALAACLLPLAMVMLTWFWTLQTDPTALIRAVAPVAVAGMCVNTVIEVVQLAAGNPTIASFLPRFWGAPGSTGSVAANAAENGRFTGIFDQPAEAGIAYGAALLCLIWLSRRAMVRSAALTTAAAVMLITGGVLTVSKIFLLGALPISVIMVLRGAARIKVASVAAMTGCGLWLAGRAGLLPGWPTGSGMLARLAHPGMSLAKEYTGGRYSPGGTGTITGDVLRASPWDGFGARGLDVPYDSLWVQAMVLAGVLGVVLVASALVVLAFRWLRLRGSLERPEWHLAGATLALMAGASLGIPSLTANRASTLLWLVIGVLITASPANQGLVTNRATTSIPPMTRSSSSTSAASSRSYSAASDVVQGL